ncbi:MAG: hypothetical protein WA426_08925, partial [Silvibacterium sp.]
RRHYLPRLLLTLSLKDKNKNHPTDLQLLTGHTISVPQHHHSGFFHDFPSPFAFYSRSPHLCQTSTSPFTS